MMKLLAVILSVSAVAYARGGSGGIASEWSTYKHWAEMKAQESCWGEENMKQYMVNMKKAVAKCNQVDAPELSLPPFKSTYRFINTLLSNAEDMENNKIMFLFKMMSNNNNHGYHSYNNNNKYEHIFNEMFNKHSSSSYRPYSSNYESSNSNAWMEKMMKKVMMQKMFEKNGMDMDFDTYKMDKMSDFNEDDFMKSMMEYKMKQMDTPASSYRERMAELLSRNKRQADKDSAVTLPVSLDIGDRLADKVKDQQQQMQEKIGNMTCVLRECGILNENNELDARLQKQYMNQFKVDKWLKERVENDIETCVEYAQGIPSDYMESYNFPGYANVAQIKTYMRCIKYSKMRSCMYKDVKEKLEANFGPLEKILEQTNLTEDQLYPLVMNLMHGDEMEFDF